MKQRNLTVRDRAEHPIAPGDRVRILAEPAQEGEVRYLVPQYNVLTVIVDGAKTGKSERMVRGQEVERLASVPTSPAPSK